MNRVQTKRPFIHKFKNGLNRYIYDANTGEIFNVKKVIYDIINYIYEFKKENSLAKFSFKYPEKTIIEAVKLIKNYISKEGVFLPSKPSCLEFYNSEEIRDKLENELNNLTLIVTERCNMRCSYCVYSGIYKYERTHSNSEMSEQIAYNAIDFIFNHSKKSDEIILNFYGGEPLLNFPLIEKSVDYIKKRNKKFDKKLDFTLTTNGTLLDEEYTDFLINHKIGLAVSLDGPEEIHDRYRVFSSGSGTYRTIYKNLLRIRKKNEEFFRTRVALNIVLTPPFNLFRIEKWFNENKELLHNKKIMVNLIIPFNNDFYDRNNLDRLKTYNSYFTQEKILLNRYLHSIIKDEKTSNFLNALFDDDLRNIHLRKKYRRFGRKFRMGHLCIPGLRSLLVDTKGKFHFCPNISSNMEIGDVTRGFDLNKISNLISQFLDISRDCLDCWAIRLCNQSCFHTAAKGAIFDIEQKRKICLNIRENTERILACYCEFQKNNPEILNKRYNIKLNQERDEKPLNKIKENKQ